jgi:NAD(P)-dependent dehydrogenase (short-subunit alcohol dehydrogenase family)
MTMTPSQPTPDAPRRPVAVVTGARQGIGFGIAGALAAAGFDLVLLDRDWDAVSGDQFAPLTGAGARVHLIGFDLAQVDRHEAVAKEIASAFGPPDCLVNNAGVQVAVRGDMLDVTADSFDRVLDTNLRGTFFFTQAVSRRMIEAGERRDGVHRSIIVVSSINATQPAPDRAEYCLSKAALSMMTQLFALRLAPAGICAYEIRPGIIRTAMTAPAAAKYDALIADGLTPIARWGTVDDVGRTVATLAQGGMAFSTGQAFHVDGGLHIHRL